MRATLFRGKQIGGCEWVYGDLLIQHPFRSKDKVQCCISSDTAFVSDGYTAEDPLVLIDSLIDVIPETVGQFTDLFDCNRIKIFEGDILRGTSYLYGYDLVNGEQFNYEGVVEWQEQADVGLRWILRADDGSSWDLSQCVHRNNNDCATGSIIGTIYDHLRSTK